MRLPYIYISLGFYSTIYFLRHHKMADYPHQKVPWCILLYKPNALHGWSPVHGKRFYCCMQSVDVYLHSYNKTNDHAEPYIEGRLNSRLIVEYALMQDPLMSIMLTPASQTPTDEVLFSVPAVIRTHFYLPLGASCCQLFWLSLLRLLRNGLWVM